MFFIHVTRIYNTIQLYNYTTIQLQPYIQTSEMLIEGAAIAIVYFIIRFLDMRFVSGEAVPLKVIIQNVLSVYASAIIGLYTLKQFNQTTIKGKQTGGDGAAASDTPVFISAPGF